MKFRSFEGGWTIGADPSWLTSPIHLPGAKPYDPVARYQLLAHNVDQNNPRNRATDKPTLSCINLHALQSWLAAHVVYSKHSLKLTHCSQLPQQLPLVNRQ